MARLYMNMRGDGTVLTDGLDVDATAFPSNTREAAYFVGFGASDPEDGQGVSMYVDVEQARVLASLFGHIAARLDAQRSS